MKIRISKETKLNRDAFRALGFNHQTATALAYQNDLSYAYKCARNFNEWR